MRLVTYAALLLGLASLLSTAALASSGNERSVNIRNSVRLGKTQLTPGTYKVEWTGTGPAVNVDFMLHGKVVASSPATLKTNDKNAFEDDIITSPAASNARALHEIDFRHDKEALIFPQKAM